MDIADVDSLAIGNGVETKEVCAERGNDGDVPADHDGVDDDDVDDDDEDDDDDNDDNDVDDSLLFVSEYPSPLLYYRPPLRRVHTTHEFHCTLRNIYPRACLDRRHLIAKRSWKTLCLCLSFRFLVLR